MRFSGRQESHSLAITRWRQKAAVCLTDDRLPRINSRGHSVIFPHELTAEIAFSPLLLIRPFHLSSFLSPSTTSLCFINQRALPEGHNQNLRKWIIAGGWKILFRLNYRWRATLTVNRIAMYGQINALHCSGICESVQVIQRESNIVSLRSFHFQLQLNLVVVRKLYSFFFCFFQSYYDDYKLSMIWEKLSRTRYIVI